MVYAIGFVSPHFRFYVLLLETPVPSFGPKFPHSPGLQASTLPPTNTLAKRPFLHTSVLSKECAEHQSRELDRLVGLRVLKPLTSIIYLGEFQAPQQNAAGNPPTAFGRKTPFLGVTPGAHLHRAVPGVHRCLPFQSDVSPQAPAPPSSTGTSPPAGPQDMFLDSAKLGWGFFFFCFSKQLPCWAQTRAEQAGYLYVSLCCDWAGGQPSCGDRYSTVSFPDSLIDLSIAGRSSRRLDPTGQY